MKPKNNWMGKVWVGLAIALATQVPARADGISEAVAEFAAIAASIAAAVGGVIAIRLGFVGMRLGKKVLNQAG